MKIAVSAEQGTPESLIDPRFGRASCFMVFDDEKRVWEVLENAQNVQAAQGAGIQSAAKVVNAGCQVLISGHCGPKAFTALTRANVAIYSINGGTVGEAVDAYGRGLLSKLEDADVEGHW